MENLSTNLKYNDNVIINYGVIVNVSAVVNWVEYNRENGEPFIQIWLKDVKPNIIQGHTEKFIQHIPNPVPLDWVKINLHN